MNQEIATVFTRHVHESVNGNVRKCAEIIGKFTCNYLFGDLEKAFTQTLRPLTIILLFTERRQFHFHEI